MLAVTVLSVGTSRSEETSDQNYLVMLKPFFVWHNKVLRKVNPVQVLYLSTERNYTKIVLIDNSYFLARTTLSAALKKLPPDIFIKIHRRFVASVYHLDSIQKYHLQIGEDTFPIGRQYYKSVITKLNIIE